MPTSTVAPNSINARIKILLLEQQEKVWRRTSRLFAWLLLGQWLASIIISLVVSPFAWEGSIQTVHLHVWTAMFLGAAIIGLPVWLAFTEPEKTSTRHLVGVAQMLLGALLIHLTGGRIETHFHVFGSLAFLSFYRDWRVLLSASLVVVLDHVLRGVFFPQSVYGVLAIEPLRWLEHAWWVIFEDAFLIKTCLDNIKEMQSIAARQAELEETRSRIEQIVDERTLELSDSKMRTATLYVVSRFLNGSATIKEAAPKILRAIRRGFLNAIGPVTGTVWEKFDGDTSGVLHNTYSFDLAADGKLQTRSGAVLPGALRDQVSRQGRVLYDEIEGQSRADLAFPILAGDAVIGVIELQMPPGHAFSADEKALLESIGRQLGQFTVQRQAEAQKIRLAQIVQSSDDAIISTTLDRRITSWNQGAEKIFGYTAAEVWGKSMQILHPSATAESQQPLIAHNVEQCLRVEEMRMRKDGTHVPVALTRSAIHDEAGNTIGVSCILRDITARYEAEKRVSEFYSIVSHELRTPLTSVRGALGLIEGGIVENGTAEALDLIKVGRESADRLIRLINDMLDLKKLESGMMELDIVPLRPHDVVRLAMDGVIGFAEEAQVSLRDNVQVACRVAGDQDRVVQVLTNLISNAIKFSPAGDMVEVSVTGTENGKVRFSVTDRGCGISSHDMHKLFGKFQQLDSSDTRQKGGSGLGLSICKALIEQHGGEIGLVSDVGAGSTFWFELLLHDSEKGIIHEDTVKTREFEVDNDRHFRVLVHEQDKNPLAGLDLDPDKMRKVLIADDDQHLRTIITKQLQAMGIECIQAADGIEAISMTRSQWPDLIILDVSMPYMDGFKVVEVLSGEKSCSTPLIVYTGRDLSNAQKNQLTLGSTRYITKGDISQEDVAAVVMELLAQRRPQALVS